MDYYLQIPQDVKLAWAQRIMTPEFWEAVKNHPRQIVTLQIMVKDGRITGVFPPEFTSVEPRRVCVTNGRSTWWSVVRRLMSVAGHRASLVEIRVLIGDGGEPVMWEQPIVREMMR